LKGWEGKTSTSLHKATAILGALRMLTLERMPNYLELATEIRSEGLSSGSLPFGEVLVNFQTGMLVYTPPAAAPVTITLTGNSQASLLETLLMVIEECGYPVAQRTSPQMSRISALLVALAARQHPFLPKREEIADETPLEMDLDLSADYSRVLYRVFTATARFRARLVGPQTPVVVWPEHFDLSFLWFPTSQTNDEAPQMNFGFAPFSPGLPRPYLYAYAYPMPEGFQELSLPQGARWNTEGWQGLVFPYDELAKKADFEQSIEGAFRQVYGLLAPSLEKQALTR
jgi:hypothetical protein